LQRSEGDVSDPIKYIRGWSDKYLASKRTTKILEKWRFISQHNLLLARYTWPSDDPTSLTRLINTFSRGLQNRPLWRRRPPHSTQISVQRVTFLSSVTKRSHTGPNLENMVDGVAVRSPIRPIWPWRGRKCLAGALSWIVTVHSIQALFDFAARFPCQKQESNHRPILLFLHFCKIRGHVRFHTQSKLNYESDSAEISTVTVYENVLHDSKFLLR